MHELSVVSEIIRIVSEHSCLHAGAKVERIDLVVGELTGHSEEMLQYYFDILSGGTALEGARLHAEYVRPVLTCPSCGLVFEKEGVSFACPCCRETAKIVRNGSEFYIDSIEVS